MCAVVFKKNIKRNEGKKKPANLKASLGDLRRLNSPLEGIVKENTNANVAYAVIFFFFFFL